MPMLPGGGEWIVIAIVVMLLFGAKRLPEMGRSLGTGLREFKKSITGEGDNKKEALPNDSDSGEKPAK